MQISLGLPDPREESSLPVLKRVQAGISHARLLKGAPSRIRLPITIQLLGQIRTSLERSFTQRKVYSGQCTAQSFSCSFSWVSCLWKQPQGSTRDYIWYGGLTTGRTHIWCRYTFNSVRASTSYWAVRMPSYVRLPAC